MFRRLINRIQGKVWSAECQRCAWSAGRSDLTEQHAFNRAKVHAAFGHGPRFGVGTYRAGKKQVVINEFFIN